MCARYVAIFIFGVLSQTLQSSAVAKKTVELNVDKPGEEAAEHNTFPQDFLFGVSISAPQYEGAWNASDKGESAWDHMIHANPELTPDCSNIDVANDFYHKYKEDLRLARTIGTQLFRFSISWPRILPNGFTSHVSKDGVAFYRNLLDEILANGMIPMVTLFQWDLPYDLQKMGGFTNPLFVDWFEQYARFAFSTFGDKVRFWTTINEPNMLCYNGSTVDIFPFLSLSGIADYLCGHHVLLAHARAYRLYDREFRSRQKGKVGYTINFLWSKPLNPASMEDVTVMRDDHQWFIFALLDPIFSSTGDYPSVIKERVANYSRVQGFSTSRLPSFTEDQIRDIRGSADFLGINYFTTELVTIESDNNSTDIAFIKDIGGIPAEYVQFKNTPWILAEILQYVNKAYQRPTIYITENGFPDSDLNDVAKVTYLQRHLTEVLKAIQSGMDIRGYLVWSLMDCFQWHFGYEPKFGLFRVDFNDPNLTRTPRLSSSFVARVYKTRRLEKTLNISHLFIENATTEY